MPEQLSDYAHILTASGSIFLFDESLLLCLSVSYAPSHIPAKRNVSSFFVFSTPYFTKSGKRNHHGMEVPENGNAQKSYLFFGHFST
ncbi:MAG: hypothetical protein FWG94_03785 [Oscillospiraceae bacterium]|nr:hypothetical protein [Oscillospiraceae bacterium]